MFKYTEYTGIYRPQPGEIWRVGERAILAVGNLLDFGHNLFYDLAGKAKLTYVGPPWNQAMVTQFYGKADLVQVDTFEDVLMGILTYSGYMSSHLFMEMGKERVEDAEHYIGKIGGVVLNRYPITYNGDRPCYLIEAWLNRLKTSTMTVNTPAPAFEGMDDAHTPRAAITGYSHQGDVIFDPCTGRGLTAVTALETGRRFVGCELNPMRAAITLQKLTEIAGIKAERYDTD